MFRCDKSAIYEGEKLGRKWRFVYVCKRTEELIYIGVAARACSSMSVAHLWTLLFS